MLRWLVIVGATVALANCANEPKKVDAEAANAPAPADVQAAAKLDASYVSEVEFAKNESALGASAQESLNKLVSEAKAAGKIDEIKVAVWADAGYPTTTKKQLNSKQRDLASRRAEAIEDYLDGLSAGDVDVYNMAERPNALEKLLNTSDARVKRAVESAGLGTPGTVASSKASHAVVMVVLKE